MGARHAAAEVWNQLRGVEYTQTIGVAQLDDYDRYFIHFPANVHDRQLAQALGIEVGAEVEYYLRRAYDLWNTRYFIVPFFANGWRDATRASASFVFQSVLVYPPADRFIGPKANDEADKWIDTRDFRVLRNLQEYPRAWVVHRVRTVNQEHRQVTLGPERNHAGDPLCQRRDLGRRDRGPFTTRHSVAWVSKADFLTIRRYLSGQTDEAVRKSPRDLSQSTTRRARGQSRFAGPRHPRRRVLSWLGP